MMNMVARGRYPSYRVVHQRRGRGNRTHRTVGELITELENFDPDAPVRIAFQPTRPLRAEAGNVVAQGELVDGERDEDPRLVWIAATTSVGYNENPYAPREAWQSR
jgi:hypothetical protein